MKPPISSSSDQFHKSLEEIRAAANEIGHSIFKKPSDPVKSTEKYQKEVSHFQSLMESEGHERPDVQGNPHDQSEESSSERLGRGLTSEEREKEVYYDAQPSALKRKKEKKKEKENEKDPSAEIIAAQQANLKYRQKQVDANLSQANLSEQKTHAATGQKAQHQQMAMQQSSEEAKSTENLDTVKNTLEKFVQNQTDIKSSDGQKAYILETADQTEKKADDNSQSQVQSANSQTTNQQPIASSDAKEVRKESTERAKRIDSIEKLFQGTVNQLLTKGTKGDSVSIKLNEQILPQTSVQLISKPEGVTISIITASMESYKIMKDNFSKLSDVFAKNVPSRPLTVEMAYTEGEVAATGSSTSAQQPPVQKVTWDTQD